MTRIASSTATRTFSGAGFRSARARFVGQIGLHHIEARVRELTTRLIEGAERRQLRVRTPIPWEERAGIVSIDLRRHAGEAVAELRDQASSSARRTATCGRQCTSTMTKRISIDCSMNSGERESCRPAAEEFGESDRRRTGSGDVGTR